MAHAPLPLHLAPSLLAADLANLGEEVARCARMPPHAHAHTHTRIR
jgi:pentose-5-phosphate-3-epimerase